MDPTLKKRYLIGGLALLVVLAGIGGWFLLKKAPSEEEGEWRAIANCLSLAIRWRSGNPDSI